MKWQSTLGYLKTITTYLTSAAFHLKSAIADMGVQLRHLFPKRVNVIFIPENLLKVRVRLEGELPAHRRFSSRGWFYLAASNTPSIVTNSPVPAEVKHPHNMVLPQPCFTVFYVWCVFCVTLFSENI